jgi:hypothetical protein
VQCELTDQQREWDRAEHNSEKHPEKGLQKVDFLCPAEFCADLGESYFTFVCQEQGDSESDQDISEPEEDSFFDGEGTHKDTCRLLRVDGPGPGRDGLRIGRRKESSAGSKKISQSLEQDSHRCKEGAFLEESSEYQFSGLGINRLRHFISCCTPTSFSSGLLHDR